MYFPGSATFAATFRLDAIKIQHARIASLRKRKKRKTERREGTITIPEVVEFNQLELTN